MNYNKIEKDEYDVYYNEIINKYNKKMAKVLKKNKKAIINTLVNHYNHKKYKDIITDRYDKITFGWFFNDYTFGYYDNICNSIDAYYNQYERVILDLLNFKEFTYDTAKLIFNDNLQLADKLEDNNIYNYPKWNEKEQEEFLLKLFGRTEHRAELDCRVYKVRFFLDIIKRNLHSLAVAKEELFPIYDLYPIKDSVEFYSVLGTSNDNKGIPKGIIKTLDIEHATAFTRAFDENNIYIFFPVGFTIDHTLLHEINHAIKTGELFDYNDEYYISKKGLSISCEDEHNALDEVINELDNEMVVEEFHKTNKPIFKSTKFAINFESTYEKLFPMVLPFYKANKEIINDASITNNSNMIYKVVDKEKYKEYNQLLTDNLDIVWNDFSKTVSISENEKAIQIMNDMQIEPKEEMTIEEYQKLYPDVKIKVLKKQ